MDLKIVLVYCLYAAHVVRLTAFLVTGTLTDGVGAGRGWCFGLKRVFKSLFVCLCTSLFFALSPKNKMR